MKLQSGYDRLGRIFKATVTMAVLVLILPMSKISMAVAQTAVQSRSPSASDIAALVQIANSLTIACTGSDTSCTVHLGIVAGYALVGYTDKANSEGCFLATNASGTWTVITHGAGWLNQTDLEYTVHSMSSSTASKLEAAATPIWNRSMIVVNTVGATSVKPVYVFTTRPFTNARETIDRVISQRRSGSHLLEIRVVYGVCLDRPNTSSLPILVSEKGAPKFLPGSYVMTGAVGNTQLFSLLIRRISKEEFERAGCPIAKSP